MTEETFSRVAIAAVLALQLVTLAGLGFLAFELRRVRGEAGSASEYSQRALVAAEEARDKAAAAECQARQAANELRPQMYRSLVLCY